MSTFWKTIALLLFSALFVLSGAAQDDTAAKRTAGKKAYDDGVEFIKRDTAEDARLALVKFRESERLYTEIGDDANAASALIGTGLAQSRLGDRIGAIESYNRAIPVFEKYGLHGLHGRALYNLGRVYAETGDNEKALELHLKALRFRRAAGDKFGEAHTLNGIGLIYSATGQLKLALEYHNRALRIFRTFENEREIGIVLNNIGLIYASLGNRKQAVEILQQSLDARVRSGDRDGEAVTLSNIGLVVSFDDPSEAILNYQSALKIADELGYQSSRATLYGNLSAAMLDRGETAKAIELARKSIAIQKTIGSKTGEATSLNNLAQALHKSGAGAEAFNDLTEALALAREAGAKPLEAIILGNLMFVHRESNAAAAIFFGKRSVNLYQEMRFAIRDFDAATQRSYLGTVENNYRFLADILIENGFFGDAQTVLAMLKDEEFSKFTLRSADETKSPARQVSLSPREQSATAKLESLSGELSRLRREIDAIETSQKTNGTLTTEDEKRKLSLIADLDRANAEFRRFLTNELASVLGKGAAAKIAADSELQSRVRRFGQGTAMVSTVISENRYRVILTTANKQIAAKTEIPAKELNRLIFEFRDMLKKPSVETRVLGKRLYDILVKPIERELNAGGIDTLVWSLDGALRYVPLAALSPDGSSYMVEKYRNVVLTAQTRDDVSDSKPLWKALGMGVTTAQKVVYPDYPDDPVELEALPAIEEELKTIVRQSDVPGETGILEGRRYINEDFTIDSLTRSLSDKQFTVVHLASHFRLAPNWSDSFLLIGGGQILTLEKLSGADAIDFSNVDLVTLSACNTAGGNESAGREVDGLAGVIQLKNGRSVLATLWEVEDASTAELMGGFYRSRSSTRSMTKAAALQKAQLKLIYGGENPIKSDTKPVVGKFQKNSLRPLAHPAYWAAFVLIGNWQ